MSLQSLCNQHSVTIYAVADSRDTSGAVDKSDRWAATGTTKNCRIQPLSAFDVVENMQQGFEVSHRLYFTSDPSVGVDDKITYGTRVFIAKSPGRNFDELGRLWVVVAQELEART